MKTPTAVEIFVLCYNRPDLAMETLRTLAAQTYGNLKIIVSDNSSKTPLDEAAVLALGRTEYRRRQPSLPPEDHFNTILKEASGPYFMMVHDDDLYLPACVEKLVAALDDHPAAIAACPNAFMMWGSNPSRTLINPSFHNTKIWTHPRDLMKRYLRPDLGINPFPGYLYRRSLMADQRLDSREAGKYSDASFLVRLLRFGTVVWLGEPLMYYRRHAQNDSGTLEWRQTHKLVLWACQFAGYKKEALDIQVFRHWIHLLRIRDLWRKGRPLQSRELIAVSTFFLRHPLVTAQILLQKFKHRVVWFG